MPNFEVDSEKEYAKALEEMKRSQDNGTEEKLEIVESQSSGESKAIYLNSIFNLLKRLLRME